MTTGRSDSMTNISSLNTTSNHFGFTLQTSSGDTISLSMYDDKSVSLDASCGKCGRSISMSLRHEYGYSFHYEGNGIDAQDRKEIEEAMKIVKPIFKEFLKHVEKSDKIPGFRELTNIAQVLRDELPEPGTPDTRNLLKNRTVDTMDGVLALFERNDKLLESAKALFDKMFDRTNRLDLFV